MFTLVQSCDKKPKNDIIKWLFDDLYVVLAYYKPDAEIPIGTAFWIIDDNSAKFCLLEKPCKDLKELEDRYREYKRNK